MFPLRWNFNGYPLCFVDCVAIFLPSIFHFLLPAQKKKKMVCILRGIPPAVYGTVCAAAAAVVDVSTHT